MGRVGRVRPALPLHPPRRAARSPSRTGSRRSLLDAADAGDAVAQAIVADKGRILGTQARASRRADRAAARGHARRAHRRRVRPSDRRGSPTPRWPSCRAPCPSARGPPPIAGALLLALDRLGVERRRRPRSPRACRSPYPKEGARHGRDRPRPREQGVPRRRRRRRRRRALDRRRRVHGAGRPVGLRQVDAAADDRRARGRVGRARSGSATATSPSSRRAAATSRWCSRTTRSTRTCACGTTSPSRSSCGARRSRRCSEQVDSVAGVLGLTRADRPQAGRALGRPAPARGDRARDGARAAGLPDGRAALQPRREAARRHARGARAAAPAGSA